MKKQIISFHQLAALSFLKFGKLDGIDMTLIMRECSDIVTVELLDESDDYFLMNNGRIMLEENYIKRFNKNVDKGLFEEISWNIIQKYLDNIDMYGFVLRKIKMLNPCCADDDEILKNFCLLQIKILKKLYQDGYVMDYLMNDSVYGDYEVIKSTKRGELYLFLVEYKNDVDNFRMLLRDNGYNTVLIDAFLITQDLSMDIGEILTLDNFVSFYGEYDVNSYLADVCKSGYKKVKVPC